MNPTPRTVTLAVRLLLALVALGAVVTVVTVVQHDALMEAWSVGHPTDSEIQPLSFVPVTIVLYVVYAGLILVLVPFLLGGTNWGRHCLVALIVGVMLATVAALRTDPPLLFVICSVASLPLDAALVYLLLHRDTTAFVRGEQLSSTGA